MTSGHSVWGHILSSGRRGVNGLMQQPSGEITIDTRSISCLGVIDSFDRPGPDGGCARRWNRDVLMVDARLTSSGGSQELSLLEIGAKCV
ncbi:hypothetical protein ElyMa_001674700 [Elysia marginata]|uniref:Uncharacterized protein n=1 Tax=Elysia marginata TaxID=1093978 RepID=A0AAV4JQ62_9GAST|nr:hypothetical protein ElyMa_001674700 [Elysia marginata]